MKRRTNGSENVHRFFGKDERKKSSLILSFFPFCFSFFVFLAFAFQKDEITRIKGKTNVGMDRMGRCGKLWGAVELTRVLWF